LAIALRVLLGNHRKFDEEGLASDIVPPSASTRSPVGAGAAFVLAGPVVAVAVVAHDGGVRLICAG
jgi:hypothetical protein